MPIFLNDAESDRMFLSACLRDNPSCLDRWQVDSYANEVAQAIMLAIERKSPERLDLELIQNLIIDCTSAIYEQYATVPNRFSSLKTRVRRFAFAYAVKFLRARYL